jgi:hypothetical protein
MTSNLNYFTEKVPGNVLKADLDSTMGKLWSIWARQMDDLDFVIGQLKIILMIQQNSGLQLDQIGALIGQPRAGTMDSVYRVLLEVATVDEEADFDHVITTINLLLRGENFTIQNVYPAGCIVSVENPNPVVSDAQIAEIVAGLWKFARRFDVVTTEGADAFAFLGATGKGFDDTGSPGTGGIYADLIYSTG